MKLKKQIKLGAVSLLEEDNFFFHGTPRSCYDTQFKFAFANATCKNKLQVEYNDRSRLQ